MHICVQGGGGVIHHVYVHTSTISFGVFTVFETQINHVFDHYFMWCRIFSLFNEALIGVESPL